MAKQVEYFTIVSLCIETDASKQSTAQTRVDALRKNVKLQNEVIAYLNRKLKSKKLSVSGFTIHGAVEKS